MRIAIVYPALRTVGGAENAIIWLMESLVERGHHVFLFTREFSEEVWGNMREKSYTVCLLDYKKQRSTLKTNRNAGMALRRALKLSLYDFDVVNPHSYPASLWVYYARLRSNTFPFVLCYLHNLTWNFYEKFIETHSLQIQDFSNLWNRYRPKKLLRRMRQLIFNYRRLDRAAMLSCDKILANSRYTAALASKIYGIEVSPCPLGVSLSRLAERHPPASLDQDSHNRVSSIVTVARLEGQKNIDTILQAIKLLKERNVLPPRFHYTIVGSGPRLEQLQKRSRELGIVGLVRFTGSVPHQDVWKLYEDAAFLVHVPLDEPLGLVPLEAALFKKTSIVSSHGGPAEIVVNGVTGLHVDALNPSDVAEKIELLLTTPDRAVKMGEAAWHWVMKNMTWDRFVDNFEDHLQKTTNRSAAKDDLFAEKSVAQIRAAGCEESSMDHHANR